MRPPSISDADLLDALAGVISRHGYEGASLSHLSEASGLRRASLYHRFPGGKNEIRRAVVDRTADRFAAVLAPAFETGDPRQRASRLAEAIGRYYRDGQRSCLIVALSVAPDAARQDVEGCIDHWLEAFARLAGDGGRSSESAMDVASEQVALIEGCLVIAQVTGNTKPFLNAVDRLADRLVPPG